jgi:hypothetical protein
VTTTYLPAKSNRFVTHAGVSTCDPFEERGEMKSSLWFDMSMLGLVLVAAVVTACFRI